MAKHEELFDHDVLRELRDMLGAGLDPVLDQFASQAAQLVGDMQRLLAAGDTAGVRPLAHKLKGSAGTVGARQLSQAAAELEKSALAGDTASAEAKLETLAGLVPHTLRALRDHRAGAH